MTYRIDGSTAARRRSAPLAAAALLLLGCSRTDLLGVSTPDQITPGAAANAAGANAQRIAAIGNFATFFAGDVGGSFPGLAMASGVLSDEMESARGGTEHLDQRAQNEALQIVPSAWSFAGQANTQLIRAIGAVEQYVPASATRTSQIAELYALRGFTYVMLGENYCNAIPIGDANDAEPGTEILDNTQLFNRALEMFAAVGTTLGTQADARLQNLAAVGRGRALLDLNRPADAATAVASVPTDFAYNVTYSTTTINNALYNWMNSTLNFAPADREGGNGLDFVSANDPRVTVVRNAAGVPTPRAGQDGVNHFTQTVHTTPNSPVTLASGIEARLIEAEAMIRAGNPAYIQKINEARALRRPAMNLPDLAPAVGGAAQVDQLMRERAFWFWGTAHRVGDLRRLTNQYGRPINTVWPVGQYFKGGTFGTHVNLKPAQAEQNNPEYKDPAALGCDPNRAEFTKG